MTPEQPLTAEAALASIRGDTRRYQFGFQIGREMSTVTRYQIYEQVLGKEARNGREVVDTAGDLRHSPGYYDIYKGLSRREIDSVLDGCTILLATATVLSHFDMTVRGVLRRAEARKLALASQIQRV